MAGQFIRTPFGSAAVFDTFAHFPSFANQGALAFAENTQILYIFDAGSWIVVSGSSAALSIAALDSQPANANALALVSNALSTQSADATHPGVVNNTTQTFSGNKTFTGAISASNLSGTNTGDVTIGTANGLSLSSQVLSLGLSSTSTTGALSSTDWNTFNGKQATITIGALDAQAANANGVALVSNVLSLQSADATHPGVVNNTTQTFSGSKVFSVAPAITDTSAAHNVILAATSSTALTADRTLTIDTNNVSSTLKMGANLTVTASATVSGTNTGDITLASVGASPAAAGASLSGQQLTLQPFDGTHPGVVTASGGGSTNFLRADGTWATPVGFTNPMTTLGDIIYENSTPAPTRLAGNITSTKNFLTQTGTGSVSAAPTWGTIASTDLPTISLTTDVTGSGSGGSISTTIASHAVSNSKFRQSAAQSVVGNSTNSTADVADISASAADQILRATGAGTAIGFGSIDLSKSGAVGASVLGVANGGTSQSSFTKGDLIVAAGSTTLNKLAVGSNNNVLIADSAQTNGVKWGTVPASSLAVTSQTSNYSIQTSDDVILVNASGGAFNVTLPTAVGNTGKVFYIKNLNSTNFTATTILTTSSQTIDGFANRTLNTQYEEYQLVSDGSNWQILNHFTDTPWTTYTLSITGTTTNPTKGTLSLDKAQWRRSGQNIELRYDYIQTAAGASGSGTYLFSIPTGVTFDTGVIPANTSSASASLVGAGSASFNTATNRSVYPMLYDTTHYAVLDKDAPNLINSSDFALGNTAINFSWQLTVPVSGWCS